MEENIATNEDVAEILVTEKVRIQKHKVRNPVVKSRPFCNSYTKMNA